jgi:hypothetical protein
MPVAFPPCPKIMLSVGDTRELKKEKKTNCEFFGNNHLLQQQLFAIG